MKSQFLLKLLINVFAPLLVVGAMSTTNTGCASKKVGVRKEGPQVKTAHMLIPADQVRYYSPNGDRLDPDPTTREAAPANSADSVISQGPIEAYPVARYVDPSNPDIMHERHVVYRRQSPRWKLQAPPSQQIIVGPVLSSTVERSPIYSQEADAFLREQQLINEGNRRALEALFGATKGLQEDAIQRRAIETQSKKEEAQRKAAAAAPKVEKEKEEPPPQTKDETPTLKRGGGNQAPHAPAPTK